MMPGFAAKVETKKVWVLNALIVSLQSLFISRGGSQEKRETNIQEIIDRQIQVENDPRFPPICVYPEGTQSNGSYLLTFKKGAFAGLNTVQPVVIKYSWDKMSPTWEGMPFICHGNMMLNCGTYKCEVSVLPPFKPNDYLFSKHGKEGQEKWEVFAEAVRDVMAKQGNLKKCD